MKLPDVKIKKILFATDLSDSAVHAFSYAVSLADVYGAGITTLHVFAESSREEFISNRINADILKGIKNQHYSEARKSLMGKKREHIAIKEVLQAFSDEVRSPKEDDASVVDEIIIEEGNPAEVIVETAKKSNCDIIVMGTHGHGVIANVLIGSTSKSVVRKSTIPVLVIRLP
jgi:nucleotide-binding universal stress UspA family protein